MPIRATVSEGYTPEAPAVASSGFVPSVFQQGVFDFVERGQGHGQVGAVAGSGKSTTIKRAVERLPLHRRQRTLVLAYNKHIADAMRADIAAGVTVKTNHALGMSVLSRIFQPKDRNSWVDPYKYNLLTRLYWERELHATPDEIRAGAGETMDLARDLARFVMVTLTDPQDSEALLSVADRYGVYLPAKDEETVLHAVPVILRWGIEGLPEPDRDGLTYHPAERIAFDDMISLPHVLGAEDRFDKFDLVFVDECQDLFRAQLATAMAALSPQGRLIAVGDRQQAIYAFSGADAHTWDEIAARTNATQLPLSICYRCTRRVVAYAQRLVPHIEASPAADDGVVQHITEESALSMARPGDAILCRTNAPLLGACYQLIARGVGAKVLGRDIGAQIIKTLDQIEKMHGFEFAAFPFHAEEYRRAQLAVLMAKKNTENQQMALNDRVDCLLTIFAATVGTGKVRDVAGMRTQITGLFAEGDDRRVVILSSMHKSKGLEWERVFILNPHLVPHPMADSDDAIDQEFNLAYVAITRAQRELYLAHDPEAVAADKYADDCPFLMPARS